MKWDEDKFGKLPKAPWGNDPVGNQHTGKIWMTKGKVSIRIMPEQEEKYNQMGYRRGMAKQ